MRVTTGTSSEFGCVGMSELTTSMVEVSDNKNLLGKGSNRGEVSSSRRPFRRHHNGTSSMVSSAPTAGTPGAPLFLSIELIGCRSVTVSTKYVDLP